MGHNGEVEREYGALLVTVKEEKNNRMGLVSNQEKRSQMQSSTKRLKTIMMV